MALQTDWSIEGIAQRRARYFSPTTAKFVPFRDPIAFRKGHMQYLWDTEGANIPTYWA